jgi:hypothetical protein
MRPQKRVNAINWAAVAADLDGHGWAVLAGVIDAQEGSRVVGLYDGGKGSRSHVAATEVLRLPSARPRPRTASQPLSAVGPHRKHLARAHGQCAALPG